MLRDEVVCSILHVCATPLVLSVYQLYSMGSTASGLAQIVPKMWTDVVSSTTCLMRENLTSTQPQCRYPRCLHPYEH